MKLILITSIIFFVGCSDNPLKHENKVLFESSFTENVNGMERLAYFLQDNLTISDFKKLFGDDFDEKSKFFNPQTQCYEYRAHIYPSLNKPVVIGFNQNENYVYIIDISNKDLAKRKEILWAKDLKKDLEKELKVE